MRNYLDHVVLWERLWGVVLLIDVGKPIPLWAVLFPGEHSSKYSKLVFPKVILALTVAEQGLRQQAMHPVTENRGCMSLGTDWHWTCGLSNLRC